MKIPWDLKEALKLQEKREVERIIKFKEKFRKRQEIRKRKEILLIKKQIREI